MNQKSLLGWSAESIKEDVVRGLTSMDEVQRCVQAMLLFWLQVLVVDYGHLPVPFYCGVRSSQVEWVCGSCLIRK